MKIPQLTDQQLNAMMEAAPCIRIKTLRAIYEAMWTSAPTAWLLDASRTRTGEHA